MSAVSNKGLVRRVTRPFEASSADERTAQSFQVRRYARIGVHWLALTLLAIVTTGVALVLVVRPGINHAVQIAVYLAISGVVALALGQGGSGSRTPRG